MSISREAFIKGAFASKDGSNDIKNHRILKFLLVNSNKAFKSKEIAKVVRMTDSGVRHMLRIFKKAGLVQHKAPYFIAVVKNKR